MYIVANYDGGWLTMTIHQGIGFSYQARKMDNGFF